MRLLIDFALDFQIDFDSGSGFGSDSGSDSDSGFDSDSGLELEFGDDLLANFVEYLCLLRLLNSKGVLAECLA